MDNLDCKNILIDIDGVLTDNKIWYNHKGEQTKGFNSSDVWAIRELISLGYRVVLVTASSWPGIKSFAKRTGAEVMVLRDKENAPSILGIDSYVCIVNDVWDFGMAKKAKRVYCPSDAIHIINNFPNAIKIPCKGGEGVISYLFGLI